MAEIQDFFKTHNEIQDFFPTFCLKIKFKTFARLFPDLKFCGHPVSMSIFCLPHTHLLLSLSLPFFSHSYNLIHCLFVSPLSLTPPPFFSLHLLFVTLYLLLLLCLSLSSLVLIVLLTLILLFSLSLSLILHILYSFTLSLIVEWTN